MPVEEAPDDDDVRQTYNFAPGSRGLVYRADVPDRGAGGHREQNQEGAEDVEQSTQSNPPGKPKYKLQAMKWGLVPFWTRRSPDYASVMRTINARDDSLASKVGMWNTMKQKKRCVVIAQGFYEWLKKNGGKEKIPHYTKRKDGQLMCFAGLWDCVQYEGADEKLYTYTVITTDSNKQLSFLHDRMPVILENGSDQIRTWLDPERSEWSKDLQSLLKPFAGELECYPVSKDVGKVGNNSPAFIVPVASAENKNNIANFFGNAKNSVKGGEKKKMLNREADEVKDAESGIKGIKEEADETRLTVDQCSTEDNAPLPVPAGSTVATNTKREHEADDEEEQHQAKIVKKEEEPSPIKSPSSNPQSRKTRSATSNRTTKGSPTKSNGSQKITNFLK